MLKLYVWTEFQRDYTLGLAFAIAHDSEEARRLVAGAYLSGFSPEDLDSLAARPLVFELDTTIAFARTGGG